LNIEAKLILSNDMSVGVKFISFVLGGALLIYGVMLLLVTTVPSLSAAQILPQYPIILIIWIGICLVATVVWRKKG
jgi:hypothetical protein